MKESLSTFMGMAAIVIVVISLIFGVTYHSLKEKSNQHKDILQTEHQIPFKN